MEKNRLRDSLKVEILGNRKEFFFRDIPELKEEEAEEL